jgi:hypothetical protein
MESLAAGALSDDRARRCVSREIGSPVPFSCWKENSRRGVVAQMGRALAAPDGVGFSQVEIRSETEALVLCMPDWAIARLQRRYPESACRLKELLRQSATGGVLR